jgi:iron complex transport system permease protein
VSQTTGDISADVLRAHRARNRTRVVLVAVLGLLALAALVLDLVTGPAGLPLDQTLKALIGADVPRGTKVIVLEVRLPVAVMALLVGAALGLAGAEMQTVLDNPLAEPFTLGVSGAAALGAALGIVLGISLPGLPPEATVSANAFLFAIGALVLLQLLAGFRGGGPEVLVLFGIALSFAAQALLALVQYVATADTLQQLVYWTMGSLSAANWTRVQLLALVLCAAVPFSFMAAWKLTALKLGSERASSLGINLKTLRRWALLRISLLAATSVALTGIIGFIGLAGPHIARLLVGQDHRFYLPTSLFTGALLLSLASTVSKTLIPGLILPIGIVTTLIGLPVFVWLIARRKP